MQIWKLNSCPKCKTGALFLDRDNYGRFLTCGNCGWSRDLAIDKPLPPAKDDVETDREGILDGCNIASSCFQCPLPDCAWETPHTRATYIWDQNALALFEQHKYLGTAKAVAAVAQDFGVTERTVYRAIKRNAPHQGEE
jgi:hypothetical protein